jgi:myo-inositol-1(or 4)-monophosphatase
MKLSYTEISRLLETAIVAARLAGARAMEELRYTRPTIKSEDELVTQADPICQKIIMDQIRETYPDHGFIAEEGTEGKCLKLPPRASDFWWVIDPIDGTNNFANGLLCFTVSIAVFYEGRPIVGVIFEPSTDSMYTAAEGMEAQLNGSRIQVCSQEICQFASFGIDTHCNPAEEPGIVEMFKKTRVRCLGSTALHLAYVAKGSMIGSICCNSKLWDIAAGIILIERAGGFVDSPDLDQLYPIDLHAYEGRQMSILTSTPKTRERLLELFKKKNFS